MRGGGVKATFGQCPKGSVFFFFRITSLNYICPQVPPKGRRLLVVATSSQRAVLDQMEMIPCFTDVLHVPNLSTAEHLLAVIRESKVSREERREVQEGPRVKRLEMEWRY